MTQVHQIWQGDSIELCKKFQAKKRIKSVITDPPFGVDNLSNMAVTTVGKQYARKIANDENPKVAKETFAAVMGSVLPGMMDNSDIYVFTAYQVLEDWLGFTRGLLHPYGFERKAILIWEKEGPGMGDLQSWGMGIEFILYFKRGNWEGHTRRNPVLHVPQLRPNELIHPHEKPTALLGLLIKHSTDPGDFIVDPFGGSGSLVRAARELDRSAVAIELDEFNYKKAMEKLKAQSGGLF
jgi:DNA modification methylase